MHTEVQNYFKGSHHCCCCCCSTISQTFQNPLLLPSSIINFSEYQRRTSGNPNGPAIGFARATTWIWILFLNSLTRRRRRQRKRRKKLKNRKKKGTREKSTTVWNNHNLSNLASYHSSSFPQKVAHSSRTEKENPNKKHIVVACYQRSLENGNVASCKSRPKQ